MSKRLKCPWPYFGGKSSIASLVWERLGDVQNYIEPFCGSGAVLLSRPHRPSIETVNDPECLVENFWRATDPAAGAAVEVINDLDTYLANAWRSIQQNPEDTAAHADYPVNEAALHSRHRWLVLSDDAERFRQRMRTDPFYFDTRFAGYWIYGICCWIGSGWCVEPGQETNGPAGGSGDRSPKIGNQIGTGIHAKGDLPTKKPQTGGPNPGSYGVGVHAKGELSQQIPLIGDPPRGVHHAADRLTQKRPSTSKAFGLGIHAKAESLHGNNRPQLADAFSRGRGVNGNDQAETCRERREWLLDWFGRLRDRLRSVRVCCGDWSRVCSSDSVTTRLGSTGVFLDPPYGHGSGRDAKIYSTDSMTVAADVRKWCLEYGPKPGMRIALCGYAGEGHEELIGAGWTVEAWAAQGGYGNRSENGRANAQKERIWFSPGCHIQKTLWDTLENERAAEELSQAIPPAYTRYVGLQLMNALAPASKAA